MAWHVHLANFCGGLFLANGVPHFVNGISGRRFPTPFASPPGVGGLPSGADTLAGLLWAGFECIAWSIAPGSEMADVHLGPCVDRCVRCARKSVARSFDGAVFPRSEAHSPVVRHTWPRVVEIGTAGSSQ